jgi:hypothetical protein
MNSRPFDHLVGAGREGRRHFDAQRPRGVKIDHELEAGRLHHWQISGLFALENSAGIDGGLPIGVRKFGAAAHQAAGLHEVAPFIDRRNSVARGQHHKLLAPGIEQWRRADLKRTRPLSYDGRERCVEIAFCIGAHDNELHAQGGGRLV